eukprot:CFRG7419T1
MLGIELYVVDHNWHHVANKGNFGKRFSLWDRVFDTYTTPSSLQWPHIPLKKNTGSLKSSANNRKKVEPQPTPHNFKILGLVPMSGLMSMATSAITGTASLVDGKPANQPENHVNDKRTKCH